MFMSAVFLTKNAPEQHYANTTYMCWSIGTSKNRCANSTLEHVVSNLQEYEQSSCCVNRRVFILMIRVTYNLQITK